MERWEDGEGVLGTCLGPSSFLNSFVFSQVRVITFPRVAIGVPPQWCCVPVRLVHSLESTSSTLNLPCFKGGRDKGGSPLLSITQPGDIPLETLMEMTPGDIINMLSYFTSMPKWVWAY